MHSIIYPPLRRFFCSCLFLFALLLSGAGVTAQSVSLFRPADDPALLREVSRRDADLTAFRVLQLDATVAGDLQRTQADELLVTLPDPRGGAALELELDRFDLLGAGFTVTEMPANRPVTDLPEAVFYRGTVRHRPTSVAVLTVIDGAVSGLVSLPGESGELNLVRLDGTDAYLFYDDAAIEHKFSALNCDVIEPDDLPQPASGKACPLTGDFGSCAPSPEFVSTAGSPADTASFRPVWPGSGGPLMYTSISQGSGPCVPGQAAPIFGSQAV